MTKIMIVYMDFAFVDIGILDFGCLILKMQHSQNKLSNKD